MSLVETGAAIDAAIKEVNIRIARVEKALAEIQAKLEAKRANGSDEPAVVPSAGHERGTRPQRHAPR